VQHAASCATPNPARESCAKRDIPGPKGCTYTLNRLYWSCRSFPRRGTKGELAIEPTTLARILAEAASEAKAEDVVVLDIHDLTVIADLFVICTADNERLLRAISRLIQEATDKIRIDPRRIEGSAEAGWILLDYSDVIVHIFGATERQFYRLEDVWSAAQTLLVIQ
jgi:ribosome-associated protein